ncbi:hypothetical protein RhiJN_00146 [Ceratobasidium sp. AG-Ba]|nr:hypothetical protein RhiJN_00146 [Ceratobasidium sp. AG-Ba]
MGATKGPRGESQQEEGVPLNYQHLYVNIPLPNYPQYNNRDHYPIEAPEPTQDDPHFEFGWPAPPSPGLEPTPFDRVLMKGWGGRTEYPLAPPKSPSVLSYEDYIERQEELTQDQGQESLPEPDHDSEEEEDEPEVVRTGILELAYPPSPVYAPEESSDSGSDSSESSGELRVMELDLERRVEEQTREFEKVSARLRAAQRCLREMMDERDFVNNKIHLTLQYHWLRIIQGIDLVLRFQVLLYFHECTLQVFKQPTSRSHSSAVQHPLALYRSSALYYTTILTMQTTPLLLNKAQRQAIMDSILWTKYFACLASKMRQGEYDFAASPFILERQFRDQIEIYYSKDHGRYPNGWYVGDGAACHNPRF